SHPRRAPFQVVSDSLGGGVQVGHRTIHLSVVERPFLLGLRDRRGHRHHRAVGPAVPDADPVQRVAVPYPNPPSTLFSVTHSPRLLSPLLSPASNPLHSGAVRSGSPGRSSCP